MYQQMYATMFTGQKTKKIILQPFKYRFLISFLIAKFLIINYFYSYNF